MLDLDRLDLAELCEALEDNTQEHEWWLDPSTGELELWSGQIEEDDDPPYERGLVFVEPIGSGEAYGDMEDFAALVGDPRTRELLQRALAGRGAFRRFKDTLLDFSDLRTTWFRFHDSRMRRRAIEWLGERDLIEPGAAASALAAHADPDTAELAGLGPHAHEIARAVASDLRELYGARLEKVILFGSWARGDAHAESDIDLLVVLDEVASRRIELERMSDLLWRHSLAGDTVVTEVPVSASEFARADEPLVARARAEGIEVG